MTVAEDCADRLESDSVVAHTSALLDCAEHSKRIDQCDKCTVLLLDSLRVAQESSREPFVERQQQLDKIFAAAPAVPRATLTAAAAFLDSL